jgi:hypothetical protein
MHKIIKLLEKALDILVPRVVTEYIALKETDQGLETTFPVHCLRPGERPDGVILIKAFNLFGFATFPSVIGEAMTWDEYLKNPTKGAQQ